MSAPTNNNSGNSQYYQYQGGYPGYGSPSSYPNNNPYQGGSYPGYGAQSFPAAAPSYSAAPSSSYSFGAQAYQSAPGYSSPAYSAPAYSAPAYSAAPGYSAAPYSAAPSGYGAPSYSAAPATSVPGGYGINPPGAVPSNANVAPSPAPAVSAAPIAAVAPMAPVASMAPVSSVAPVTHVAPMAAPNHPVQFVDHNGVMGMNPEYIAWHQKKQNGGVVTSLQYPNEALPVVCNRNDFNAIHQLNGQVTYTTTTTETIQRLEDPAMCARVGIPPNQIYDQIGAVFARREIPIGLLNKLMRLTTLDGLEFIMDDSGSMGSKSDTTDLNGHVQTRWQESCVRLKDMIEILAYIPIPPITIRFLNRDIKIHLKHDHHHLEPENFIRYAYAKIDEAFYHGPDGGTPAKKRLTKSICNSDVRNKAIGRYFFCDGNPNDDRRPKNHLVEEIKDLVKRRPNPERNPLTFISCTNEDEEVEWMKDVEEVAPFCSEVDDFSDECREVMGDQGHAFPFTRGFHLISQLIASMCPEDLDAMDESVPFTKATLDNLLGINAPQESYQHYFQCFVNAQQHRPLKTKMDQVRKGMNWMQYYNDFLNAPHANNIQVVQQFKQQLAHANHR